MRRLVTALLLQAALVPAPVVDERLDDARWQKAKEALGASPASTIVHSHFSKWLDDRLDAALGDDAGATGVLPHSVWHDPHIESKGRYGTMQRDTLTRLAFEARHAAAPIQSAQPLAAATERTACTDGRQFTLS